MSETTTTPVKTHRINPNANPEGSAFLITLLQRYVDQVPGRTRRELQLAQEIDARPGGRDTAEQAVRSWRALPVETRAAAVGTEAAAADHRARVEEDALLAQARRAFRARGVRSPQGFSIRAATSGRTPVGAPPFTLPAIEADGPLSPKQTTDAATRPGETAPDPDGAGTVLGNPPPVAASAVAGTLYRIRYVGLYCKRESSWDGGSNSDEPYVSFNMTDDANHSWAKRTGVYSDVDKKESRGAKPDPLVLYGPAHTPSERTYISALVTEHDFGDPEKIKKAWHDAATLGQCVAKYYGVDVDQAVVDSAANLLNLVFNLGDDVIGWDSVVLWPESWEWFAAQPLLTYKGITYHFFLFHTDNDSEFYTFYRIDRLN